MFVSVWLCWCHQISQKLLQGGGRGQEMGLQGGGWTWPKPLLG